MAVLSICGAMPVALSDTQPTYDRRIEEAAIRMLQPKLGDIRGGLDLVPNGHLYPPLSQRVAAPDRFEPAPRRQVDGSFIRY
ncbi:hypothetical protein [Hoeflea ulvae]|uniref:Uncharacterized protein n=1 Tax=Hoeflea ulvae TaxID=2983764 RepID=A0ABT3YEH0_9HYPH|nr:hypothetical protein [Hoeflea ulvae]MCY0094140.1 hypothetical protein [Hoeflea ulvae]